MDNQEQNTDNYLESYLNQMRTDGRYAFTFKELEAEFYLPYSTFKKALSRLKSKNEIAQVRQGFYVIVPPQYAIRGILPPYLYIDALMTSLNKPYYVGLFSAAVLYGAARQQPMEDFVFVQNPAPQSIDNDKFKINFLAKTELIQDGIIQRKTRTGYMNVSTPELTALDLFDTNAFSLSSKAIVLQELAERIGPFILLKIATQYPNTAAIQRLGYVLEWAQEYRLAKPLAKFLKRKPLDPIPLSYEKEQTGEVDSRWQIIKNVEI